MRRFLTLTALLTVTMAVSAQQPTFRVASDVVSIDVTVRDRAITLNELKVFYTDGSDETVPVRTRVDAGGTYGPIDLSGQRKQPIDHIEAKYRSRFFDSSAKGKGSAIVEIWGQH